MNIVITGGGTGGHLAIAKSLKDELNKRGIKPIYIGSQNGQDKSWFENDEGFGEKFFLPSSGVVNKKGIKKLFVLIDILKATFTCKKIFKKYNINAVFCVGGYSAAPASFASILSFTPLYIHEQNAVIGSLNKLLKPFAKEFFSSYDNSSFIKDYPVNEIFFKEKRVRKKIKTVIFLGGSQGAQFINDLAMKSAKELVERNIKIIHQTGKNDYKKVDEFYKKHSLDVDYFDFTKEIISKIKVADFAISRAGASTLWELSANLLPTVFVPYPYAAKNHQYFNAKALEEKNMAMIKTQDNFTKEEFLKLIENTDIEKISTNLQNAINKDGIEKIAELILKADNG